MLPQTNPQLAVDTATKPEASQAEGTSEISQLHSVFLEPHSPVPSEPPSSIVQSSNIPKTYVVVPLEDSHSWPLRAVRIIVPCEAPSIKNGYDDQFHKTDHGGYIVMYPGDIGHHHRTGIKLGIKAGEYIVGGAAAAVKFLSHLGDTAVSALSSLHQTMDNRDRLEIVGIDNPDNFFTTQLVVDNHQKRAMVELLQDAAKMNGQLNITGDLKGIILDGRTIWVCDRCYDCLQKGERIEGTNHLTLEGNDVDEETGYNLQELIEQRKEGIKAKYCTQYSKHRPYHCELQP
ncbi:hypothetical protein BGZ65_006090 [Modicella reniformis]|uniref:Uncharacterized protein n=1 Tax=Modicella reniformis TaxID=1440133 RepID=A0A9P6JH97_9FUNG|nr:hypothetical protein BGZ65_006090 [Modicella reniformis]